MELKDAYGILANADKLYEQLKVKHDVLLGRRPEGALGIPSYDTLDQILHHVRCRRNEILDLRKAIEVLERKRDAGATSKELQSISDELAGIAAELKL